LEGSFYQLCAYQDGFKRSGLRDHPKFVSIILAFKEYFGLGGVPVREIDHFLWLYGQGVIPDVADAGSPAPLSGDAQGRPATVV